MASKTAFIGVGVMGEAILAGVIRGGRPVGELLVGEKRAERAAELTGKYGVEVVSNVEAVRAADTVTLVVKPQDMATVLAEIRPELRPGQLLVSLAAGITTAWIEDRVPAGVAVVRVMPNTPALVDQGISAISPGTHCDEEHLATAESLLSDTGRVVRVPESQQNAVTAVSGSGPAYIFYIVEAMIDAGVMLGLPRPLATELAIQTLFGSATMLRETGTHPTILREQVTSPGGTTAAALRYLEDHRVKAAFLSAMEACRDRAEQLAAGSRDGRAAQAEANQRATPITKELFPSHSSPASQVPLVFREQGHVGRQWGSWRRAPKKVVCHGCQLVFGHLGGQVPDDRRGGRDDARLQDDRLPPRPRGRPPGAPRRPLVPRPGEGRHRVHPAFLLRRRLSRSATPSGRPPATPASYDVASGGRTRFRRLCRGR